MNPEEAVDERPLVLVADDEPTSRLLSREALEWAGFAVVEAEDGDAALAAFERKRPALVLLDVDMPGQDGYAVCRTLRARPGAAHLPIVMLTGYEDAASVDRAYAGGATDFISKPVNWALLGHRARYILRASQAMQDLQAREQQLRLILDSTLDLIVLFDRDGRSRFNSRAVPQGAAHYKAARFDWFAQIHPADQHRMRHAFREIFDTGMAQLARYRRVRRDGSIRFIEAQGTAVRDVAGAVSGVVVVSRDVTLRTLQQEKIDRLNRIGAVLSGINSAIVRIRERTALCEEACRIACTAGQFGLAWIGVVDHAAQRIELVACHGEGGELLKQLDLGTGEQCGLAGGAVRSKVPVVVNDIATDPRVQAARPALARGFRSLVCLPLLADGAVAGVLALYATETGGFDDAEMKLLGELAGDVGFGLGYIEKEQERHQLAYFDALTGLPNRQLYQVRLATLTSASRNASVGLVVAVIDIKGFHIVNDNLGRQCGDTLLRQFAQRLRDTLRKSDTACRLAGDQFGVILTDVADAVAGSACLEKLLTVLTAPYTLSGSTAAEAITVSVKCGATLFPGASAGADAGVLLTQAEAALNSARSAPEQCRFYAPGLNAAIANRLAQEGRLRRALAQQQFVLHYQPKVEAHSGRISGLEALIRWNDPGAGLVPPAQFMPLLEDSGLIVEAGAWILRQAMTDLRRLHAAGYGTVRIAVNVSAVQFRQNDFIGYLEAAIGTGVNAAAGLDLEITESVMMQDQENHIDVLGRVRAAGIGVALDDFGTGYSSLSYLARFPANVLKIDRSFVIEMSASSEKLAIVSAVIALGHAFNMKIVAEGVETAEQARLLTLLKCDQLQGYLFARPAPLEQIEALLARQESAAVAALEAV